MIVNLTVGSVQEADEHIDKALAAGLFPIANVSGVMIVHTRELAVIVYHAIVERLADKMNEELVIYFSKDGKDRECLSVMPNTPHGVQIYGVHASEFDFPNMLPIKRTMQ